MEIDKKIEVKMQVHKIEHALIENISHNRILILCSKILVLNVGLSGILVNSLAFHAGGPGSNPGSDLYTFFTLTKNYLP